MLGPEVRAPEPPAEPWRKRLLNMAQLVDEFDAAAPIPWVLEPLVIPGTLAIVVGQGGSGKTWVLHEAAHAVATGTARAGMVANHGGSRALIIDAEMGPWLTVQRFKQQGYDIENTQVLDATGLNLSSQTDRQELWSIIVALAPQFIGWDSLAALTAGADENGKETGDLLNWVRTVHQQVPSQPAGLMIHHAGWKEERTRGSSTIRDRVDAVWYFKQSQDDEHVRELSCHGTQLKAPRWCRPPEPLYMRLRPEGGLAGADRPKPAAEAKQETEAAALKAAIRTGEITSKRKAKEALGAPGMDNAKISRLLEQIGAHQIDGVFTLGASDGPAT
jgi:hypothetical protein